MAIGQIELDLRFGYFTPEQDRVASMEMVRAAVRDAARVIDEMVPDGREKSLAFTNLEQAVMWGIKGLARPVTTPPDPTLTGGGS